ncbi:MAG: FMN-binding protein [Lachnospiraceae bacterium]|nr:MAG: FMN-binding protein [Lachnospiraceae bacterium]
MKDKITEKNNIEDTDRNIEKNIIKDKAIGKNNVEDTGNAAAKNITGEDKVFEKIKISKNLTQNLKMLIFIIPSIVIAGFSLRGIYVANNDLAHYRKIEKNILADISGGNDDTKRKSEDKADTDKTDTKLSDTDTKTKVTAVADTKKKSGKPADGEFSGESICEKFGYTVSLKVRFKNGETVAVYGMKMSGNTDSANNTFMNKAWSGMVNRLVGKNVSDADAVSGATYSSKAIINAYMDAYNKAVAKADGKTIKIALKKTTMPVSTKKPVAIKVDKKKKVPKSSIADGNYKVSAVCEPDENEDFEKYLLSAVVKFSKGKCVKIADFLSTAEANKTYYMRAANGASGEKGVVGQIVNRQSSDGISAVSGATCSSKTIVNLYLKALNKAAKKGGIKPQKTPAPSKIPVEVPAPADTAVPANTVNPLQTDVPASSKPLTSSEPMISSTPQETALPEPSILLRSGTYSKVATVYPDESKAFEEYTISADLLFNDNHFAGFSNVVLSDETNRFYYNKSVNGTKKIPGLLTQINAALNGEFDAVSGATCTSKTLIGMYREALDEAVIK